MSQTNLFAATIGVFDGVHRGHCYLVAWLRRVAEEHGLRSMLITMHCHPREVVGGQSIPLLTPFDERLRRLSELHVDAIETLQFTSAMAAMSAHDFMRDVLRDRLGVRLLVMGYNHRFGHDGRTATLADYQRWGEQLGITVVSCDALDTHQLKNSKTQKLKNSKTHAPSSSAIRRALAEGDISTANIMLGRRYTLCGRVVEGSRIGRQLGFPTANILPIEPRQMLPRDGVYAVYLPQLQCRGMMNIGLRPTVDDQRTLEVHAIDYDGQLYGQQLQVQFIRRLRDTQQFASLDELREQLVADREAVRSLTSRADDERYMARCVQLARHGSWHTQPNPMVGAVIVHRGRIIGEGYHRRCGEPHAEVNAINSVRQPELLCESTIYVSLEPCAHYGKTPPCADLIIAHHIPRVVIGCQDTFARVNGLGIQRLRDAGCEVVVGVLERECRALNKVFFTFHGQHRPYITLKWAQSSDGFIDRLRTLGDGQRPVRFSTPLTTQSVHRLRVEREAILVGWRTWQLDQPQLTARLWPGRQPRKIVLERGTDLHQLLADLYHQGVQSLLVEGGARTLQRFIDAGLYDEVRVETAPFALVDGVAAPVLPTMQSVK